MESSSASSGCDYATGCRRACATAGNATGSPSAIRGGGRELAIAHGQHIARQTKIGLIKSTEASTTTFGRFTTPRRTWPRTLKETGTGAILPELVDVQRVRYIPRAHEADDEDMISGTDDQYMTENT
ncbi:hypothetical protein V496_01173 [Pseudogymnoascus sp. VKM F-4515 (FW-2607)]|nr:hypothetical protein V496_01173 [Pseudogymnoascus sp. VKM F-4515 (FW-2607)]KFY96215.1 hypothetical protein V498_02821 [Pseudogymnoascus sp. VKM F-4517 (FW-2822)]